MTFDTPQYRGVKAAAMDARNALQSFIVDSIDHPGQMEKFNQMLEFVNESRRRGIDITPESIDVMKKQFGIEPNPNPSTNSTLFKQNMKRLSDMYEARSNMAENSWRGLGKDGIQRWIKENPRKWKAIKATAGTAGLGVAGNVLFNN